LTFTSGEADVIPLEGIVLFTATKDAKLQFPRAYGPGNRLAHLSLIARHVVASIMASIPVKSGVLQTERIMAKHKAPAAGDPVGTFIYFILKPDGTVLTSFGAGTATLDGLLAAG
jgi:hypothetical protein